MKYLPFLLLLALPSCAAGPLATDSELQQNSHEDQSFTVAEVTQVAEAAGVVYTPGDVTPAAPVEDPFWEDLLMLLIPAVLGTGGAVALRARDHAKKAKKTA